MCNCKEGTNIAPDLERSFKTMLKEYKDVQGALIPVLQKTQDIFGFLPEHSIRTIAEELKIPASKVYGVATFYAQFHLEPRGKYIIRVCLGTACHVRGGMKIMEAIENKLGIKSGQTTEDFLFTIEPVACLGACGLAPVIMINDETYGRLTPDKVSEILAKYQ